MTGEQGAGARHVGMLRMAIGLAQGVALGLLWRSAHAAWAVRSGAVWAMLTMLALFVPPIPLAALGRMRAGTLAAWTALAAILSAGLAWYDIWRALPAAGYDPGAAEPSAPLVAFGAVVLYVLHHLIEPADVARRWRPPYPAYVEAAWRHAFQLLLSLGFAGVLWGVLKLGAAMFRAIGVQPLANALDSTLLEFPLLGLAFAIAIERTEVSPGMIEGVRGIALTLFAWLLPVAVALTTLFLFSLPFTGLRPLWATSHAAALLLGAASLLIVLVNAAYQDGGAVGTIPAVIRWSARTAGAVLPILVGLAVWALLLRVGQYGLSPERAGGIALCLVLAVYALGYAWAAASRGRWMAALEPVNIGAAIAGVVVILLVLSPAADPARLAANDQARRLVAGRVAVERFDFAALRFRTARYGREALAALAHSADPRIATHARAAQQLDFYGEIGGSIVGVPLSRAVIRPANAVLPQGFRAQRWSTPELRFGAAACLVSDQPCNLFVIDLDRDGTPEVVAMSGSGDGPAIAFARTRDGVWRQAGVFFGEQSAALDAAVKGGAVSPVAPLMPDLRVGTTRLRFNPDADYERLADAPGRAGGR